MPNELKMTSLTGTDVNSTDRSNRRIADSSTVMVWTISGILLAACGGGSTRYVNTGDGVGGGAAGTGGPSAAPIDFSGTNTVVMGAEVAYTDADGMSDTGMTDQYGLFDLPEGATIDSITVGTTTLTAAGGGDLMSHLTTLVAATAMADDTMSEQDVLDSIFGEGAVTLANIADGTNYYISDGDATLNQLIARAEHALVAIAGDAMLSNNIEGGTNDAAEMPLAKLQTLFAQWRADFGDDNPINNIEFADRHLADGSLKTAVETAVADYNLRPVIQDAEASGTSPDGDPIRMIDLIPELDDGLGRNNYLDDVQDFFGFRDLGDVDQGSQGIVGIFISNRVTASGDEDGMADGELTVQVISLDSLDLMANPDATVMADDIAAHLGTLPAGVTAPSGFFYVSVENLHRLQFTPSDTTENGTFWIEYHVFDGVDISAVAGEVVITVGDGGTGMRPGNAIPVWGNGSAITVTVMDAGDYSSTSGQELTATDPDEGQTVTISIVGGTGTTVTGDAATGYMVTAGGMNWGTFTLDSNDGSWDFDFTDAAFDALARGTTQTLNLVAQADDSNGGIASRNITINVEKPGVFGPIPAAFGTAGTAAADTLVSDGDAHLIQGGNQDDAITSGGGADLIIGGRGQDTITLGEGAQTLIYRYDSSTGFTARDGGDFINDFEFGVDKIVFVDEAGTHASLADFTTGIGGDSTFIQATGFDSRNGINKIQIVFFQGGTPDGLVGTGDSGSILEIRIADNANLVVYDPSNSDTYDGLSLKNNAFIENILGGEGTIDVATLADLTQAGIEIV